MDTRNALDKKLGEGLAQYLLEKIDSQFCENLLQTTSPIISVWGSLFKFSAYWLLLFHLHSFNDVILGAFLYLSKYSFDIFHYSSLEFINRLVAHLFVKRIIYFTWSLQCFGVRWLFKKKTGQESKYSHAQIHIHLIKR